jgi:sugar transferase (PEP-CTERM/EpsH1 system associated)
VNILFVAPYVPSRIRVRPFHLIKELAKRHKVHVIALGLPSREKTEGVEELWAVTESFKVVPHSSVRGSLQSLAALPTPKPMCAAYAASSAIKAEISRVMRSVDFDLIHVEHLRAAQFAPKPWRVPIVFDSVDCLAGLYSQMARGQSGIVRRLVAAEEAWKLRRHEPRVLRLFDGVVITSDSEREALLSLDQSLEVEVVPNGVDVDYFRPAGVEKNPARIVFSGKMSYQPNAEAAIWFAQQVFPKLRMKYSQAEFLIVGNDPPESVKRLAEAPGVKVTGYVPDLRPHLESAAVAVAPMQVAVGVQNKVLEAMAIGLPVVTSPLAARALGESTCALTATTAEEWLKQVAGMIDDPGAAMEAGWRNRESVARDFSWQSSSRKLEAVYDTVRARHSSRMGETR